MIHKLFFQLLLVSLIFAAPTLKASISNFPDTNIHLITPENLNKKVQIQDYKVVWSQQVTEPDGTQRKGINTITDVVKIEKRKDGKKVIHRSLKWEDTNNNVYIKSDQLDYETLQPLSIDIRWNPGYVQHTDLKGLQLISTSVKNEFEPVKFTITHLEEPGFTWSSDGFMLVVCGGEISGSFALQTLSGLPHQPKIEQKQFEYVGEEKVTIAGIGGFQTRVIKDVGRNIVATYWLSEKKPYIVKVRFDQPNGQMTVWKLEELE